MKKAILFIAAALVAAVCASEIEALGMSNVPDVLTLQAKFGTFEQVVRARATPDVLMWLDSVPSAFDTANVAWSRAIQCTKNVADNAAVKVYGAVTHARAVAKNLIERSSVAQFQTFSDPKLQAQNKPVDPAVVNKNLETKLGKAQTKAVELYNKKLAQCYDSQRALTSSGIALAADRQRADVYQTPVPVAGDHPSKAAAPQLVGAFNSLQKAAEKILASAVHHAVGAARGAVLPEATPAALALSHGNIYASTPSGAGAVFSSSTPAPASAYCGAKRTCMNGGVCAGSIFDLSGRGQCACPPAWTGPSCTQMRDACGALGVQCVNGGACVTEHGAWRCACPMGFGGLYCEDNSAAAAATAAAEAKKAAAAAAQSPEDKLAALRNKLLAAGLHTGHIMTPSTGIPVPVALPAGAAPPPSPQSTVAAVQSRAFAHSLSNRFRAFHKAALAGGYPMMPSGPVAPVMPYGAMSPYGAAPAMLPAGVPANAVIMNPAGAVPHPMFGMPVPAVAARMVPAGSLSKPANPADAKKAAEKAADDAKKAAEKTATDAKKKAEDDAAAAKKKADEDAAAAKKKIDDEAAAKKAAADATAKKAGSSFVEMDAAFEMDLDASAEEFGLGGFIEAEAVGAGVVATAQRALEAAQTEAEPQYYY